MFIHVGMSSAEAGNGDCMELISSTCMHEFLWQSDLFFMTIDEQTWKMSTFLFMPGLVGC